MNPRQIAERIFNFIAPQCASLMGYARHRDRFTGGMMAGGAMGAWLTSGIFLALCFSGYLDTLIAPMLSTLGLGWTGLIIYSAFALSGMMGRGIGFYLGMPTKNRSAALKAAANHLLYGSAMDMTLCYVPFVGTENAAGVWVVPEGKKQQGVAVALLLDQVGLLKTFSSKQLVTAMIMEEIYRNPEIHRSRATRSLESNTESKPELILKSSIETGEKGVEQLIKSFVGHDNKFHNLTTALQILKNTPIVQDPNNKKFIAYMMDASLSEVFIDRLRKAKALGLFARTDAVKIYLQILSDDQDDPTGIRTQTWLVKAEKALTDSAPEIKYRQNIEKISYFVADKKKKDELEFIEKIVNETGLLKGENAQKNLDKIADFLTASNNAYVSTLAKRFEKSIMGAKANPLTGPSAQQNFDFLLDIFPTVSGRTGFRGAISYLNSSFSPDQVEWVYGAIRKNPLQAQCFFELSKKLRDINPALFTKENWELMGQNATNRIDYLVELVPEEMQKFFVAETKSSDPYQFSQSQVQENFSVALLGPNSFEVLKKLRSIGMGKEHLELIKDLPDDLLEEMTETIDILEHYGVWTTDTAVEILPNLVEICYEDHSSKNKVVFEAGFRVFNFVISLLRNEGYLGPDPFSTKLLSRLYEEQFVKRKDFCKFCKAVEQLTVFMDRYKEEQPKLMSLILYELVSIPDGGNREPNVHVATVKLLSELRYFSDVASIQKIPGLLRDMRDHAPDVLRAIGQLRFLGNQKNFEMLCTYAPYVNKLDLGKITDFSSVNNRDRNQKLLEAHLREFSQPFSKEIEQALPFPQVLPPIIFGYLFTQQEIKPEGTGNHSSTHPGMS